MIGLHFFYLFIVQITFIYPVKIACCDAEQSKPEIGPASAGSGVEGLQKQGGAKIVFLLAGKRGGGTNSTSGPIACALPEPRFIGTASAADPAAASSQDSRFHRGCWLMGHLSRRKALWLRLLE